MRIHARRSLDGGAQAFGSQILQTVASLNLNPGRAFDWCSGYGGVGYRLLQQGLCDHLVLGDINPEALDLARRTAADNDLKNVTIYETDCLDQIPDHEQWDLVVGNPPHFTEDLSTYLRRPGIAKHWPVQLFHERIWRDPDWQLHKRFFASIGKHLRPEGAIVICETWAGSRPETFESMVKENGYLYETRDGEGDFWIMIVRKP